MELATAVEVARRGALALDNARLYGRQLKVAETLQHSLLTPPPQPDHLQIAVRYRPAAGTRRSAATGTTPSRSPTAPRCWSSATSSGTTSRRLRRWAKCAACCAASPTTGRRPAPILPELDAALTGLHVGTLATALIARVEQTPDQAPAGRRSCAGPRPGTCRRCCSAPTAGAGARQPAGAAARHRHTGPAPTTGRPAPGRHGAALHRRAGRDTAARHRRGHHPAAPSWPSWPTCRSTTSATGCSPGSRPAAPTTTSPYSPCTQAPTADGRPAARRGLAEGREDGGRALGTSLPSPVRTETHQSPGART